MSTEPSPSNTTTVQLGPAERDAEPHRRRQPHRVLEIEEVRPVADRLHLGGDGAHDRDEHAPVELGVDRFDRVAALHASSHIRSRQSSSATGRLADCASVCAL